MTTYIVVLCGGADRPIAALGGRTPLEAAATPALDRLAARAALGLLTVIDGGICPESDSGIMALLGYDPHRYYTGRGALEALGMGFMARGEPAVGFRINFGSYDAARGQLDRRTARDLDDAELQRLVAALRDAPVLRDELDARFDLVGFGRHRGVVCLHAAEPLSANVSNTDPGFRRDGPFGIPNDHHGPRPLPCVPLDATPAAARTAALVNRFDALAAAVLEAHPVNAARRAAGKRPANRLLFRDAGSDVPELRPFAARHGRSLALYGQVPAEHGLCELLGGAWRDARQAAGVDDAAYLGGLVRAITADPAEVVVVHLKGPDEPGHDNRPEAKRAAIERIDAWFVAPLAAAARPGDTLIVTCDHATPCELGIHAADPVPVLVHRTGGPESGHRFCERDAARGALAVRRAPDLLDHVLEAAP